MRARIFAEENRRWWTLGALCFALFMIMLDNTVVNVALPAIRADLGISVSELEWTVAAYALTFASLLLTGGKLVAHAFAPKRRVMNGKTGFPVVATSQSVVGAAAAAQQAVNAAMR